MFIDQSTSYDIVDYQMMLYFNIKKGRLIYVNSLSFIVREGEGGQHFALALDCFSMFSQQNNSI